MHGDFYHSNRKCCHSPVMKLYNQAAISLVTSQDNKHRNMPYHRLVWWEPQQHANLCHKLFDCIDCSVLYFYRHPYWYLLACLRRTISEKARTVTHNESEREAKTPIEQKGHKPSGDLVTGSDMHCLCVCVCVAVCSTHRNRRPPFYD